jgi:chaperone modulatory protein CbpM
MTYPLVRPRRLRLDAFARRAGLHPQLVHRYVALGLLDAYRDAAGELWFPMAALARAARIERLRTGLAINYAAIGLVLDLLDQIDDLQAQRRRARAGGGVTRG